MNKNNIFITIKKELRSVFRDKKTIIMILAFPLMIGVLIFLYGFMDTEMVGDDKTKYKVGINYTPTEVEQVYIKEMQLEAKEYRSNEALKEAYNNGDLEAYILKENDTYTIYIDDSDMTATTVGTLVESYLTSYNKYLGDLYLYQNNIDPEVVYDNIQIEFKNVDGEETSATALMLTMVMGIAFSYIIISISLATINMATSAIATEKENGTLETILTLPITTNELIIGKYLATVIIGLCSSIMGFIITLVSIKIASLKFEIYKEFTMNFPTIALGILICFVASCLIAGLAIAATSSSKSYKEAQAAGQTLEIISMIPMFIQVLDLNTTTYFYFIPILSHTIILMDLYSNNINYMNLLYTIISTIIYTVIILKFLLTKFKSEKVLFQS